MAFEKLPSDLLRLHKGKSFTGITTCFMCHDGAGSFVLAKRSQNARDERGKWEIGGGGLKLGVAIEENIQREVLEEFGARTRHLDFLGYRDIFRTDDNGDRTHWVGLDFCVLVDRKEVRLNEPEQFDDIGWFTFSDLPEPLHSQQIIFFDRHREKIDRILRTTFI